MSQLFIVEHAQNRLRQRFGLQSLNAMRSWAEAKKKDGKLLRTQPDGRKVFAWGNVELVFSPNEASLLTVIDKSVTKDFAAQFGSAIVKEATKLLTVKERALRKAEINVAEITLNMLKARNPKIKAKLNERLSVAHDEKENIATEIKAIRYAAKEYGVEV